MVYNIALSNYSQKALGVVGVKNMSEHDVLPQLVFGRFQFLSLGVGHQHLIFIGRFFLWNLTFRKDNCEKNQLGVDIRHFYCIFISKDGHKLIGLIANNIDYILNSEVVVWADVF